MSAKLAVTGEPPSEKDIKIAFPALPLCNATFIGIANLAVSKITESLRNVCTSLACQLDYLDLLPRVTA